VSLASAVPPLGIGAFSMTLPVPATPEQILSRWQLAKNGTVFGQPSDGVYVLIQGTNKDHLGLLSVPVTAAVNQQPRCGTAQATFYNDGSNTWSSGGGYSLVPVQNIWGTSYVDIAPNVFVAPGGLITFSIPYCIPPWDGSYEFRWQMAGPLGPFGAITDATVTYAHDDAGSPVWTLQRCFIGVFCGYSLTLTNTGGTTWDQSYCLVGIPDPYGCINNDPNHLPQCLTPGARVPHGGTWTFGLPPNYDIAASGLTPADVQMMNGAGQLFGATARVGLCLGVQ
jgi:hypothetical protein